MYSKWWAYSTCGGPTIHAKVNTTWGSWQCVDNDYKLFDHVLAGQKLTHQKGKSCQLEWQFMGGGGGGGRGGRTLCQKGEKCDENAKGHFSKITKTARWEPPRKAAYSEYSIAIHSISKAGYVTTVLAIVRTELRAQEASSFCDFWKITSCDFTLFYSF